MSKPVQDNSLRQVGARIDSVDVDQLLRDIGEASASTSAIALFGMCLAAQRVLQLVQAGQATVISRDEMALLSHFRAMNTEGRRDGLCVMEAMAGPYRCPRPALTIVRNVHRGDMQ